MKPTHLVTLLIAAIFATSSLVAETAAKRILFLGDSLTAGYGIDPQLAYPSLIQKKLQAGDYNFDVTPAGLSGETSAGGLRRASWVLQKPVDILVIALGANDGLRGIDLSDTKKNLQGIIDLARKKYPEIQIVIAGMQMPPNLGEAYTTQFRSMYPELAQENEATLIPFLLEDVGGQPELNIADGIHPNPAGHEIIAETVWSALKPLL
ncbi:arylesterase [Pelagicoccus mobilis]|uniref:Arylesterase n=1 Tax=Pelagicoccus mobilis TaxID=415221 RepID=A0A934S0C8_9BACT|nr:arylesterase [Pelagicoccus mobilis]MBK1878669.1 arylesterase [Pelagicoccus mobilis]